ncbi:MAG: glycosyltransferase [Elusimicrobia bacterium]|nr:glycosyltransferase [Elusimicrobiota bacterium]
MMSRLEDYRSIVGGDTLEELRVLGRSLAGRTVLNVNSTAVGGGVAEILSWMVPQLNELGVETRWDVIQGGEDFYQVTKMIHNALHGAPVDIPPESFRLYEDTLDQNMGRLALDADIVFVHDPQPAGLVKCRWKKKNRWLWRCHIDLSHPQPAVWRFLKPAVEQFDACVISAPAFAQALAIPQILAAPSIDPFSEKNRELAEPEVRSILDRLGVPADKPLVTQISRFDRLKDPVGVIEAFRKVKPFVKARLLLAGGSADDDPEGAQVLAEVRELAKGDPDILVLNLPPTSHLEINAIQRASAVILQKSLREGFGLTVTEALWKGKPVIASAVGGIPLQITHEHSGALVHTVDGAAWWLKRLLNEPGYAKKLGEAGREHVRQNFLLTRHLRDYLLAFHFLYNPDADIIRLG